MNIQPTEEFPHFTRENMQLLAGLMHARAGLARAALMAVQADSETPRMDAVEFCRVSLGALYFCAYDDMIFFVTVPGSDGGPELPAARQFSSSTRRQRTR